MLISNPGFQPSPTDRMRYPGKWATGLTPGRMIQVFDMADMGQIGPLYELLEEIVGKDTFVGGPYADRVVAAGAVDISVEPNPQDPDQYRQMEACAYAEEVLPGLKLFGFETRPDGARVLTEKGAGEVSDVIEAIASPWYKGLGEYWIIYQAIAGHPRPRPIGIEYLDSRRYRLGPEDQLLLETARAPLGEPLSGFDWYRWFSVDATRAGSRIALSGVGRALVFWWWLRMSASFDLSRYLEKFGLPNVIGKQATNQGSGIWTQDQRDDFADFVESYQNDVAALLAADMDVEILTAPSGGHAVFEVLDRLTKSAILYGVLGNEVTTTAAGSGGQGVAGGAGSVGERIQYDLILGDRRRAAGGLRKILKRGLYIEFNQQFPPPLVKLTPAGATATNAQTPAPSVSGAPGAAGSSAAPAK